MCIIRIRGGFIFSGERVEMDKVPSETLVESSRFPVGLVSEKSAKEKAGGGRPPYWAMVFWWTRKPLVGARAIIAGALAPSNASVNEFCRVLKLNENSPNRHNPVLPENWLERFKGKSLLDPFAGFGSIPLEGLRLGLSRVIAVELLPTCYVFLKAILEYPLKYGRQLADDVEKWGNWITEQLKQDPIIQLLYEPDVSVYIGSWEIKCPHCDKWTPLIGNWWLSKVSKSWGEDREYTQLIWMNPQIKNDSVSIEVIDLNKLLKGNRLDSVKVDIKRGLIILRNGKTFEVPRSNIDSKRQAAVCLHCNNTVRYIDPETGKHYTDISKLPKKLKSELVWYVRYALRKYHEEDSSLVKPILLVKARKIGGNLDFEACTEEDQRKLELARREVEKLLHQGDPDIPTELIPEYENRRITPILGAKQWYQFFNYRQLLTLVKLIKLIREAGKKIVDEKLEEGSKEEYAKQYAEAVATYMAIALSRYADYNCITTVWNSGGLLPAQVAHALSMRGIAMQWNWGDVSPFADMSGTGSWLKNLSSSISRSLNYLVNAFHRNHRELFGYSNNDSMDTEKGVRVVLDNSAILGHIGINEKLDLIITDPPYYDDVPYTELSDFYYIWLKRALSDAEQNRLVPLFLSDAFFKRIGAKWVETKTQWQEFAKQEVSVNPGRFRDEENAEKKAVNHFLSLLKNSFIAMKERLKDEGLLITYYAHTSPDAWIALLEAGWKGGRYHVINAFPIATESLQRVTARGKYALDTSIVVVWKKGSSGSVSAEELYDKALKEARIAALELIKASRMGSDLFVGTMASILSLFTRYESLYDPMGILDVKSLVTDYVYPATAKALAMALGEFAGTPSEVKRPESLFYLITKALFPKPKRVKRKLDRSNIALVSIGTKADLDTLENLTILHKEKGKFYLEEPAMADRKSFEELLQLKDINPTKPAIESPIDALHLLEYYALTLPLKPFLIRFSILKEEYSSEVEEAINIATILAKTLPPTDPEKKPCQEIIARIKGEKLA